MNGPQWQWLQIGGKFFTRHKAELISIAALLLMAVNFVLVISRKSLTNDEKYHIPAGYYHLVSGNFQLNPEHPPLIKMIAALPLVFFRPATPATFTPAENPILQGHDTFLAFWEANPDEVEPICFWPRVPMILLTLLFGAVIFSYTRYVGGKLAATLAVIMFSLEPTILAHGRVVQTDVPAAFSYFLFFYLLQRFADRQSLRRAITLGLGTGVALATKFSLLIILPILMTALVVLGWRSVKAQPHWSKLIFKTGAVVIAILLVVNAAYYFQRVPLLSENRAAVVREWPEHVTALSRSFHVLSTIVPSTYLFGLFVVGVHNEGGHYASVIGNYSRTGWWYYFPLAVALKTTLPFLLISVASLVWALWTFVWQRRRGMLLVLAGLIAYAAFAMTSHINIGVRHFLPVFPFLCLLAGMFLSWLTRRARKPFAVGFIVILFSWMAIETIRAFPDYIPYMNELAWKHPHWYYLSDSNIEWGDDTGELAEYLVGRREYKVRAAVLGGWLTKVQYGVDYVDPLVVGEPEHTRYIAIGASYLNGSTVPLIHDQQGRPITEQQRHDFFAAYRERQPEAVFGHSIYLFREGD